MTNKWLGGENGNVGGGEREVHWLTPPHIVQELGEFDLDPCGAPGHVLAKRTYLIDNGENGLALPWNGRVWLNPPYGKYAERFLSRLADYGNGIALIFARTETRSFHENVWDRADGILFLAGRLTFLDARGTPAKANAGAPSCLVAYGSNNVDALASCGLLGKFVPLSQPAIASSGDGEATNEA